jgi:Fic family protein
LARPIQDTINQVAQKHRQFASLNPPPEQHERIDRWIETQFVFSTLRLEGLGVTEDEVERLLSESDSGVSPASEQAQTIFKLGSGVRLLQRSVRSEGKALSLSPELLLKLNGDAAAFRAGPGDPNRSRRAIPPEHLRAIIESICAWFTADSFAELNPLEQASIAYLRLVEIQPFDHGNERAALLAASLFTSQNELPPVIITPNLAGAYRSAIEEATAGNTQPMVELFGNAVVQALQGMIDRSAT